MKYYKILKDGTFIGVITSDNFIKYNQVSDGFLHSNEREGEFISYNGSFYRTPWMQPIIFRLPYEEIQATEINEETFIALATAIEQNEEIIEEETEEEEEEIEVLPPEAIAAEVEFMRQSKLLELSKACRLTIESGIDVELRGETQHFSLSTQDQLNLMSLSAMAQTQSIIPYHADGELCVFYTADEINQIVAAAAEHRTYHTTYYNALKNYVQSLDTIEDINAIVYGIEVPDEYKSDVLIVLEQ